MNVAFNMEKRIERVTMMDRRLNDDIPPSMQAADSAYLPLHTRMQNARIILRRHWLSMASIMAASLLTGITYVALATPRYTSTVQLLLDTRRSTSDANPNKYEDPTADQSFVDSQVGVVTSRNVAQNVVHSKSLDKDPEFFDPKPTIWNYIRGKIISIIATGHAQLLSVERVATETVMAATNAKRDTKTSIINIDFTALEPERAAEIANAIADAYISDQIEAQFDVAGRSAEWVKNQLNQMKNQSIEADRLVQEYKASKGIVYTNQGLISDQQLQELSTQLVLARAHVAEMKAKVDNLSTMNTDGMPDSGDVDSLQNPVLNRIRGDYLDTNKRLAQLTNKYGADYVGASGLKNDLRSIRTSLQAELSHIQDAYKSEYEIALSRETSLSQQVSELVQKASETGQETVKLRELESSSQAYRALYEGFVTRYTQASEQQSFPTNFARVITRAEPNYSKSSPKSLLVMIASSALGLGLGGLFAYAREAYSGAVLSILDMESVFGVECAGMIPVISASVVKKLNKAPVLFGPMEVPIDSLNSYAIKEPFSRLSDTIHYLKMGMGRCRDKCVVLGILSNDKAEGRSFLASNLALQIAMTGERVLLVDCDLRNSALSRTFAADGSKGWVDCAISDRRLDEVLVFDERTGLTFLPAGLRQGSAQSAELLNQRSTALLFEGLREHFRYVIVDLPPAGLFVDSKAASGLLDCCVLVAHWGETRLSDLHRLSDVWRRNNFAPIIGTIVNMASGRSCP